MKPLVLPLLFALLVLPGCGGSGPSPAPAAPDTAACCPAGTPCDSCTGSDSAGAVCDDGLPLDTTVGASLPRTAAGLPRLWEFGSEKCVPCKTMRGILEPLMTECAGKVDVRIINVYEQKELAQQFRIVTIPTQVFIDAQGGELFRHVGVYPRDSIAAKFAELGFPALSAGSVPTPARAVSGT